MTVKVPPGRRDLLAGPIRYPHDPRSPARNAFHLHRAGDRGGRRGAHGAGQRHRPELPFVSPGGHARRPSATASRTASATASTLQPAGAARPGPHPGRQHRRDPSAAARSARRAGPSSRSTATSSTWRCWTSSSSAARSATRRCLEPLLRSRSPRARHARSADLVLRVAEHIHADFEYARDVTLASSPIDDLLDHGKGVCQDFTHLMIARAALLRRAGPLRQRLHPSPQQGSRRATPGARPGCPTSAGSASIRPTTAWSTSISSRSAIGRDFTDVPPNKGVYRGRAQEAILVRVETRDAGAAAVAVVAGAAPAARRAADADRHAPGRRVARRRRRGATAAVERSSYPRDDPSKPS